MKLSLYTQKGMSREDKEKSNSGFSLVLLSENYQDIVERSHHFVSNQLFVYRAGVILQQIV